MRDRSENSEKWERRREEMRGERARVRVPPID